MVFRGGRREREGEGLGGGVGCSMRFISIERIERTESKRGGMYGVGSVPRARWKDR